MTRVKICGITTVSDAIRVVDAGADAIGLVFAKSPRRVSLSMAKKISLAVGPWISVVGVFVDEAPSQVLRIIRECRLSAVQLHGSESLADIKKMAGTKMIKAVHVNDAFRSASLKKYPVDAFLFDNREGAVLGGTGKTFDWKILKKDLPDTRIIISGGLRPDTVATAVKLFHPYGVDVSSGVELRPGVKNIQLVKEFVRNAKSQL